jgi:dihydrofolate reductase
VADYTWDVYSTVDGFASYTDDGDWGGYWGKEGPAFLAHRAKLLKEDQRLVLGANTFRQFQSLLTGDVGDLDPVNARMKSMPTTVISSSLQGPLDWPDATLLNGNAVDRIAELKKSSQVPLRSHGSLSMNRSLLAAGLVDRLQITIFPVVSGQTGQEPVFESAEDFDLELLETHTYDARIQEPTPTMQGYKSLSIGHPCTVSRGRDALFWCSFPHPPAAARGDFRRDACSPGRSWY